MIATRSKKRQLVAKLGSKKNPLILRVPDESKLDWITSVCQENGWHFIIGFEPDQEEDLLDLERKLHPPVQYETPKIGRNAPCGCGSGNKFKKCCGLVV